MTLTLDQLNTLKAEDALEHFRACGGPGPWVEAMVAARPFESLDAMLAASERIWWTTGRADWDEALAAHPRIGETAARARVSETARGWSTREQEAVAASDAEARAELAELVSAYERRFGWIYVVKAQDRTAAELLEDIRARLTHDPERERVIAAREQLAITQLRLAKGLRT